MENIVRQGGIACNKQFLLFSQCFLPYTALMFHFKCNFKCRLQFFSIQSKILSSGNGLQCNLNLPKPQRVQNCIDYKNITFNKSTINIMLVSYYKYVCACFCFLFDTNKFTFFIHFFITIKTSILTVLHGNTKSPTSCMYTWRYNILYLTIIYNTRSVSVFENTGD